MSKFRCVNAKKNKRSTELAEIHAFEFNIKALEVEKNVGPLHDRLGINIDQSDDIDKQRNTIEQALEELKIHNRLKGLFKKAKEDY